MQNLKQLAIRGGLARLCGQGANFVIRVGSLMILARLLTPNDFGLVGMVAAFTGVLHLLRDFGLSSAAIQRATITNEQISTLFWINMLVGAVLGLLTVAMAPVAVVFYHEPRLLSITAVLATGFVFNAAGVQHSALLQRQMRFTAFATISVVSWTIASAIAIAGAKAGYGYWALVAMTVSVPLFGTIGYWVCTGWMPSMPRKRTGIRSLLRFGGTVSLNGLIAYLGYNSDKILIGRFCGANALGIYGRAYQLTNIPTDNLNSAVGEVAFSALSRLQNDPIRLRSYFLKGYSLVLAVTLPLTIACMAFANDIVFVLLGPKWMGAVNILRLLAPTILIFAIINPLGWLLYSLGLVRRSLNIALAFFPTIVAGYVIGLLYGPSGVAFAYSAVMLLWVTPFVAWCVRGTAVSFSDVMRVLIRPLASGILAGGLSYALGMSFGQSLTPLPRLILESSALLITFYALLLFVAGQKTLYLDLIRGMRKPPLAGSVEFGHD
jgi:O-antigen/teichoic acid export membrane protein